MKIVKSLISVSLAGFLLFSGSCLEQPVEKQIQIKIHNWKAIGETIVNQIEEVALVAQIKNQEEVLRVREEAEKIRAEQDKQAQASAPIGASGEEEDTVVEMDRKRHKYIIDQLIKIRERERAVTRIDVYYAQRGSPMQGTGAIFFREFERTGVNPYLSVAISEAESTCGKRTYNNPPGGCSYNAWGMIGPEYRGGFSSWEEGIVANFNYLVMHFGCPQSAYDCPGYCDPNHPWMENVDGVREYIQNMDIDNMLGPGGRAGSSLRMNNYTKPNDKVVAAAYSQLGKPYEWGGTGPDSYDCSGLVFYCYNYAEVPIPRTADAQGAYGTPEAIENLQPGDVIGFRGWEHIEIYVGDGNFIHAPQTGDVIKVSSVSDRNDICGASKII